VAGYAHQRLALARVEGFCVGAGHDIQSLPFLLSGVDVCSLWGEGLWGDRASVKV
jgi:hypothetical protein